MSSIFPKKMRTILSSQTTLFCRCLCLRIPMRPDVHIVSMRLYFVRRRYHLHGFYRTMGEWAAYHLARGRDMDGLFQEYYRDHVSDFQLPICLEEPAPWEFREMPYSHHFSPFVGVIPDGRIWGIRGAVLTPEDKLVWDVSIEHSAEPPEMHSVFRKASLPPPVSCDETCANLAYTAGDSYFHWMLDVLPRLDLIQQSGIPIDRYVFSYMANPPLSFQQETLDMLGIPEEVRFQPQADTHIQIRRLVVPSLIGHTSRYPKWAVDYLRRRLLPAAGHSRIYISRSDARHRRVANEEQVIKLLEAYGFVAISLRHRSVSEQIGLFASAEVIVSPHGANLTNLIFCRPGTRVIELFSPGYVNPIYWAISHHAHMRYACLVGSGRRSPEGQHEPRGQEDMEIPAASLERLLWLAGVA